MSAADTDDARPRPYPERAAGDARASRGAGDADGTDGPRIADLTFVSYADFGERFFARAVSTERVAGAVAQLAGRPIDVGPLGVGPMGLIRVRAEGSVGEPALVAREGDLVAFDLAIPAQLSMLVEIGIDRHRFDATITIRLVLTARAADPLLVVIDVDPPTKDDIEVDVTAGGLRSSVLQIVAGVDGELRRSVAKFVRREIDKPSTQQLRVIDVAAALDRMGEPSPD